MKDFYEYKLLMWYPGLNKSVKKGSIATYNAQANAYQVELSWGIILIDADEVESNPDFWEMIAGTTFVDDLINEPMHAHENSKQKPLFVTDDGVELFDGADKLFIVSKKCYKKESKISNIYDKTNRKDFKYFNVEENADKYIEENKPKPLFITEDGVEVFDKDFKFILVDYVFEKFYASYVELVKPLNTDIFKYFAHKSSADEYIWRNKPLFSYEDMMKAKHSIILADEDIEKAAKERVK